MKLKKSKIRRGCGWIGFVCSVFFFIGLTALVLIGCAPDAYDPLPEGEPDIITSLDIRVWTNGHDVDPDGIDEIFLDEVEYLEHGEPPPFNLIISPAHCREYPDGLTYCGFEDPGFSFMLAGVFYPESNSIKIHLMNSEWSLEQSALSHEIRHQIMYWFDIPGWDINSDKPAIEQIKEEN